VDVPVREAIIEQKNLKVDDVSMIPFRDWSSLLEKQAEGACSEDIAKAVRSRFRPADNHA
jgi:hypothetical protein